MLDEKAKKLILEGVVLSYRKEGRKIYKRCPIVSSKGPPKHQ
jgi:hypothetical protein